MQLFICQKPTHLEACEIPTLATEDVSLILAGADHQLFESYCVSISEITNSLVNPIASGYVLPTPKMANRFQAPSISQGDPPIHAVRIT